MQLSSKELQYLLNAIDTHVRTNGLSAAAPGAVLAQKIQTAANELPAEAIADQDNSDGAEAK